METRPPEVDAGMYLVKRHAEPRKRRKEGLEH